MSLGQGCLIVAGQKRKLYKEETLAHAYMDFMLTDNMHISVKTLVLQELT